MKAAVYRRTGPPEVFEYADVPDPVCGPGDVLVQVEAISIEGGDTLNRAGGDMVDDPHIVGYQCAGTIIEVGDDAAANGRSVGQKVVTTMTHGSHAELRAVPWIVSFVIPDDADLVEAACVPIAFGTADDCLFEFGRLQAGETVLIQAGASGVGIAAIQLAKRAGATVLATASSDEKLARIEHLGLDHGINYRDNDPVAAARQLTGGAGVNLVVDAVGSTLEGSLQMLAHRGRCITVGNAGRDTRLIDSSLLMADNLTLTGVFFGGEIFYPRVQEMIYGHLNDVASGALAVIVDRTFPLADAAAAHAFVESREAVGRVVLIP
ncbi:MAG TPA: zinc-binding dehydrogenase [Acidimicrobiia bacterium]|nr:zinc-binding dehydrogenase [Acidimicrobiia bacterium]